MTTKFNFRLGMVILFFAVAYSAWYLYVPIADQLCSAAFSVDLYVDVKPDVTQQQLQNIARPAGADVVGRVPEPNALDSPSVKKMSNVWLVEVPCVKESLGEPQPTEIKWVESRLLSSPEILHVVDLNSVSAGSLGI